MIHGAGLLLVLVPVPQHGLWPMAPACWPDAAGVVHQALPELAPGVVLVLVLVPEHGPWPMAPGVPGGAGLLLLMLFTRRCPSWRRPAGLVLAPGPWLARLWITFLADVLKFSANRHRPQTRMDACFPDNVRNLSTMHSKYDGRYVKYDAYFYSFAHLRDCMPQFGIMKGCYV